MKADVTKLVYLSGFAGSAIMLSGALVATVGYRGRGGEAYSLFNHYISELGEVDVSALAIAFNSSMVVGGCLIIVFMAALGCYLNSRLGWHASGAGIFSGLACSLTGVFPMNGFFIHAAAAYSFFYSGLISVVLFILVIALDKDHKANKRLLVPGMACAASFVSFLLVPYFTQSLDVRTFGVAVARPRIWPIALLEWSVFLSVITWILVVSVYLTIQKRLPDTQHVWANETTDPDPGIGIRPSPRPSARQDARTAERLSVTEDERSRPEQAPEPHEKSNTSFDFMLPHHECRLILQPLPSSFVL